MAQRPQEEALSAVLRQNHFRFMRRHGEVSLPEIYQAVIERYEMLCENEYTCPHYNREASQPEWQHTVRSVLNQLKKDGIITKSAQHKMWILP